MNDEWVRIMQATDPDTPLYDAAVRDLEEDHAYWATARYDIITGAEALLREASEG